MLRQLQGVLTYQAEQGVGVCGFAKVPEKHAQYTTVFFFDKARKHESVE